MKKTNNINNKLFALSLSAVTLIGLITSPNPVVAQTTNEVETYYKNDFNNETTESLLSNWTLEIGTGSASITVSSEKCLIACSSFK